MFEPAAIEAELRSERRLLDDQFLHAFGIGFAKWLLKLSMQAWKLQLEINACYRVVAMRGTRDRTASPTPRRHPSAVCP